MNAFDDSAGELTGSLITMEFGPGGRIQQLWASDPSLPEEGEEFQFVLPPLKIGDEVTDDYNPGTVLIGARTSPDEPWVVSRNRATPSDKIDFDEEEDFTEYDPSRMEFKYEFPLLEDIEATGRFYEEAGAVPQIVWELEIKNRGRVTLEIGELAFPLAFNNFYDGFGWTDDHLRRLWQSRVYIHKFIGGAASWLFAQRMTAETPGLLVFPGADTGWEFFTHVRGSLNTPYQWEGIPVVYVHSKATIEREEWPTWFNDHTSLILEPGDSQKYEMRFAPLESDKNDGVAQTLTLCGRPNIKVLPSAVAPVDVGIALEVTNANPARYYLSREAVIETDSDENGSFCFIRPSEPGPMFVSFPDNTGRMCHTHLMFTAPLEQLIKKRADWIVQNQVVDDPASPLHRGVVLTNIVDGAKSLDDEEYRESSGIECALADTLFLAEKNVVYPDREQIRILNQTVKQFIQDDIQNPATHAVAGAMESGVPGYFGRPMNYPHVANLYRSLAKIADTYGETDYTAVEYLRMAAKTASALFQFGWRLYVRSVGVLGFARLYDLLVELRNHGLDAEAEELQGWIDFKARELTKLKYPFAGETVMDTSGFEEVFAAGKYLSDDDHLERTVRCAFAVRSMAPSWWWYGSDKRHWDGGDSTPIKALVDRGEACLSHTTIANSLIFFGMMDRDYLGLPEAYVRMAFGGMLGPWSLVRDDGAASMCYCPDLSSKQAGFNPYTGASGLGYYHYLVGTGSYVLPNRELGTMAFGCHYGQDADAHLVRPWDGVGRRIVMRQIGAEFNLTFGNFVELRLDLRLRSFDAIIENPSDKEVIAHLEIKGLWGTELQVEETIHQAKNGTFQIPITLPPRTTVRTKAKVQIEPNGY